MVAIEYLNSYTDWSDEKNYRNSHDNAITDIEKDVFLSSIYKASKTEFTCKPVNKICREFA